MPILTTMVAVIFRFDPNLFTKRIYKFVPTRLPSKPSQSRIKLPHCITPPLRSALYTFISFRRNH